MEREGEKEGEIETGVKRERETGGKRERERERERPPHTYKDDGQKPYHDKQLYTEEESE